MSVSQGPAKGPGNNSPAKPFTAETGPVIGQKGGFIRAKMAQYRKDNPDAPLSMSEQERVIRASLREAIPEVVDTMIVVACDPDHKDFGPTSRALVDHDLGRPKQGIALDGGIALGPLAVAIYLPDNGRNGA